MLELWWILPAVAVASIVVALLVKVVISVPKARAGIDLQQPDLEGEPVIDEKKVDDRLQEVVFEEIGGFVDSNYKRKEMAKAVSNLVDRELDERIKLHTERLREEYENEISQKSLNEEIALKKYNKVLVEKKNTEAVIKSIADGLVVVDAEGKVIMMNPAAEKLLGSSKKEKSGKPINEGLKEEQMLTLAKKADEKGHREIELSSSQNETKKIIRSSSAVIENENGETVGMVSVLSDITKQKELDRLKANFITNVTHELRTPLIAIDKSIALLLTKDPGPLLPAQEQFLDIAKRNISRLSNLINDLLDISKLESGKIDLQLKEVSLSDLADEVIKSFETWAGTKSIIIRREFAKSLPKVQADPERIIQVFNNLVGNAIKFTPNQGRILVRLESSDSELTASIEDNGPGIPKEDIDKIFGKFYQSSLLHPTDTVGTGLGLPISKEIIDLHGGRIWVESELNQGTKFKFVLPLKK
ncbi:MAG: PAS domain S-box protein [Candidatus Omnitrophica bacterium]|nr:PAS domain S-box protein [Candidatus Omnitrophota bacterium]